MSELKPYGEYKETGLSWLDVLPKHWDIKRAKNLYMKANRPIREIDDVVTCFRDGVVTLRKNRRITGFTESIKEIGYQGVRKGDLVIHVMDAFAGAVGVSDSDGKGTPVYSICISKIDLNNHYYAHIVREMAKTGFIQSLYRGIRERSSDFRFDVFANQYLPIPTLAEQDQIVKYLDFQLVKINKFIKAKKKLITVLKEQKQAVINEAVTKGINTDVKMKPSGIEWIGDIPEHWEIRKIKNTAKILRGKFNHRPRNDERLYNGNYPFIQTGDVARSNKYIVSYNQTLNEMGYCVSKEFPKGTMTMTIAANIGDVSILDFNACFPDSIIGFIPRDEIDLEYLYYTFTAMKQELLKEAPVNTQGNLNIERVGAMFIAIPHLDEQKTIVIWIESKVGVIDKSIVGIEKEIALITEYRTRLISDVVTGKVDVRNIVIDEAIPEDSDLSDLEDEVLDNEEAVNDKEDDE